MPTVVRGYARVSTDEQAEAGYSLLAQQETIQATANARGWTIADMYVDDGYSAKTMNRPALQRLMTEIRPGETILVHRLDRLTRAPRDLERLLELSEEQQLYFRSVHEEIDTTTANGRFFVRLLIQVAAWERETIGERTQIGKRKKAAMGEYQTGEAPFGYQLVQIGTKRNGKALRGLVPDEKTKHIVPMIFDRYLSGYGIRAIAKWLNEEMQVRTSRGAEFNAMTIQRILRNPAYRGMVVFGRESRNPDNAVSAPAIHEALVANDVFDRVQRLFDERKGTAPRQATGQYPLSGVARCGICGAGLSVLSRRISGQKTYAYRCMYYAGGKGCALTSTPLAFVNGPAVEANLIAEIEKLRQPNELNRWLTQLNEERQATQESSVPEIERIRSDIEETTAAINRWDVAYGTGKMTMERYFALVEPLQERLKSLRTKLDELEASMPITAKADVILAMLNRIREVWNRMEPPERKALLRSFVQMMGVRILVFPDRSVRLE